MRAKSTTLFVIAVVMAVFTTLSCQKEESFKLEKQVGKADNAKTTVSSTLLDNLPGQDKSVNNTRDLLGDYIGELMMSSAKYLKIEFKKQDGDYNLSVDLWGLDYDDPSIIQVADKEYGFHVGIWDYALEKQILFWKTWHEKHTLDAKVVKETLSVQAKIPGKEMFATKGIGERQLCIYLSKKLMGITFYKLLLTIYYTEGTKDKFDYFIKKDTI